MTSFPIGYGNPGMTPLKASFAWGVETSIHFVTSTYALKKGMQFSMSMYGPFKVSYLKDRSFPIS
jgi:hypothetical protein